LIGSHLSLNVANGGVGEFDLRYHFGGFLANGGQARIEQMFSGSGGFVIDGGAAVNGDPVGEPEIEHGDAAD
jgi:hypothetical protein